MFAYYASLGFAEIKNLKWTNINKGGLITHRNKTGELINNRLNPTAVSILGEPKGKEDYVFHLQDFTTKGVNKMVKNWVKRAKIDKHITFYCARHTLYMPIAFEWSKFKNGCTCHGTQFHKKHLKIFELRKQTSR